MIDEETILMREVTRFEVIDHTEDGKGRCYVKHNCTVDLSFQDGGLTLKIFVNDRKKC